MKKIVSVLLFAGMVGTAMAVPARRGPIVQVAEDGTEQTVYLHGDAYFHYMTDAEGNWLDETTLRPLSDEQKEMRLNSGKARKAQRAEARRAKQATGVDRLLAPRGAVILVSYSDKAFQSSHDAMTEWAMGDNYTYRGATGSIRQYFLDQSWGSYDMQIDVIGPVTVSKTASYYGKNDRQGNDQHPDELVVEACRLAADEGVDFSNYDSDGDGYVDWVVIIYAGKGEADGGGANSIWPHQYDLHYTDMQFRLNGKMIDHYCCLNEVDGESGARSGIGTFCHEFSHVMGLPDLYETNDEYSYLGLHTLMDWDIMDYGPYNNDGNTPPSYSAYERWFMGWITPTLINTNVTVNLPALNDSKAAVLLTETGANVSNILNPVPKTFYLLENRPQSGWDAYLPGEGMLITKIKFDATNWLWNEVNNEENNMGVDLMEAMANTTQKSRSTDAYPKGATSFTGIADYQVNNIALTDGMIVFDINDGQAGTVTLGIQNVDAGQTATKVLRGGQLQIVRGGVTYDVTGKAVENKK